MYIYCACAYNHKGDVHVLYSVTHGIQYVVDQLRFPSIAPSAFLLVIHKVSTVHAKAVAFVFLTSSVKDEVAKRSRSIDSVGCSSRGELR